MARRDQIVEMPSLIKRGRLEVPEHVSVIDFVMADFTAQTLQKYVNARAKETTHYAIDKSKPKEERQHKRVSASTIRKEIVTLGTVWRWAATVPLVTGPFPSRGIRLPKTVEKPPFQTWGEIVRLNARSDKKD